MKRIFWLSGVIFLAGCSQFASEEQQATAEVTQQCLGNTTLPPRLANQFYQVTDPALLAESKGAPDQGKLCQGAVYQAKPKTQVVIYRAWNSTNPNSKLGQWWSFSEPSGPIALYRKNNQICYQWSPLDKLVRCTIKPGAKIVVGNGQSAQCSQYLSYPVSATQQVYLSDADGSVKDCDTYTGVISWDKEVH